MAWAIGRDCQRLVTTGLRAVWRCSRVERVGAILIAGGPGSGKSTVSQRLRDHGLLSVDLDYGYARWEGEDGAAVDFPSSPSMQWLLDHHWQWDELRLSSALHDSRDQTAALAGTAFNMFDHLKRFDVLLLLQVDDETMCKRLVDPGRRNDFGKVGDTVEWSRYWRRRVETELTDRGAHVIDARQPVDRVVDSVIEVSAGCGYPIGAP